MSGLSGTITIPKVGAVKKTYVYGIAGTAAAYVLWRYYAAARSSSTPDTAAAGDGLETSSVTDSPAGAGSVSGNVQYAGTVDTTGTDGMVLTNDQWARKASDLLVFAGWDPQLTLQVLGKYLGRQPLDDSEALLVRAALAVTGAPPVGSYTIVHATGGGTSPSAPAPGTPSTPTTPVPPTSTPAAPATRTVVTLPAKAPTIVKATTAPGQTSISAPPATIPAGPRYASVKANESMGDWQGRVFASQGFTPTYIQLQKLNPSKTTTLEKMYNNVPHGANELRIK